MLLDPLNQFDAIAVGQVHIREAEVRFVLFQQGQGAGQVVCRKCFYPHPGQGDFQQFPDVRFVVNDQRCVGGHLVLSVPCRYSDARYPPAPGQIIRPGWANVMRKQQPG